MTENLKMGVWQILEYGTDYSNLQFTDSNKIPNIQNNNDVLIKVNTTSVNPIDVVMSKGYGAKVINMLRKQPEFPLTLGREFSGEIVQKGSSVKEEFQVGQIVFGVVPIQKSGCHAQYVTVDKSCIIEKPVELTEIEAASILYAGLTVWNGLFITGQLGGKIGATTSTGGGKGKRVCVLGASGSVGNTAVQILLAEECEVVATCSTDAVAALHALGVKNVVDYRSKDADDQLVKYGPYDIILDCAGKTGDYAKTLPWIFDQYVSFNSPLLTYFDDRGYILGALSSICHVLPSTFKSIFGMKKVIKYGFFSPSPIGIEYLKKLVEKKKLVPVVQEVFEFKNMREAFQRVSDGHLRGKIAIQL